MRAYAQWMGLTLTSAPIYRGGAQRTCKQTGPSSTSSPVGPTRRMPHLAQIALAWLLTQRPFIVPIPGARNVDHLTENLGALTVELTPAEAQQISTESPL